MEEASKICESSKTKEAKIAKKERNGTITENKIERPRLSDYMDGRIGIKTLVGGTKLKIPPKPRKICFLKYQIDMLTKKIQPKNIASNSKRCVKNDEKKIMDLENSRLDRTNDTSNCAQETNENFPHVVQEQNLPLTLQQLDVEEDKLLDKYSDALITLQQLDQEEDKLLEKISNVSLSMQRLDSEKDESISKLPNYSLTKQALNAAKDDLVEKLTNDSPIEQQTNSDDHKLKAESYALSKKLSVAREDDLFEKILSMRELILKGKDSSEIITNSLTTGQELDIEEIESPAKVLNALLPMDEDQIHARFFNTLFFMRKSDSKKSKLTVSFSIQESDDMKYELLKKISNALPVEPQLHSETNDAKKFLKVSPSKQKLEAKEGQIPAKVLNALLVMQKSNSEESKLIVSFSIRQLDDIKYELFKKIPNEEPANQQLHSNIRVSKKCSKVLWSMQQQNAKEDQIPMKFSNASRLMQQLDTEENQIRARFSNALLFIQKSDSQENKLTVSFSIHSSDNITYESFEKMLIVLPTEQQPHFEDDVAEKFSRASSPTQQLDAKEDQIRARISNALFFKQKSDVEESKFTVLFSIHQSDDITYELFPKKCVVLPPEQQSTKFREDVDKKFPKESSPMQQHNAVDDRRTTKFSDETSLVQTLDAKEDQISIEFSNASSSSVLQFDAKDDEKPTKSSDASLPVEQSKVEEDKISDMVIANLPLLLQQSDSEGDDLSQSHSNALLSKHTIGKENDLLKMFWNASMRKLSSDGNKSLPMFSHASLTNQQLREKGNKSPTMIRTASLIKQQLHAKEDESPIDSFKTSSLNQQLNGKEDESLAKSSNASLSNQLLDARDDELLTKFSDVWSTLQLTDQLMNQVRNIMTSKISICQDIISVGNKLVQLENDVKNSGEKCLRNECTKLRIKDEARRRKNFGKIEKKVEQILKIMENKYSESSNQSSHTDGVQNLGDITFSEKIAHVSDVLDEEIKRLNDQLVKIFDL